MKLAKLSRHSWKSPCRVGSRQALCPASWLVFMVLLLISYDNLMGMVINIFCISVFLCMQQNNDFNEPKCSLWKWREIIHDVLGIVSWWVLLYDCYLKFKVTQDYECLPSDRFSICDHFTWTTTFWRRNCSFFTDEESKILTFYMTSLKSEVTNCYGQVPAQVSRLFTAQNLSCPTCHLSLLCGEY